MTVIACKIENKKIELACDEMVSGSKKQKTSDFKAMKITQYNKDFAIGGAGYLSEIILFMQWAHNHTPVTNDIIGIVRYLNDFDNFKLDIGAECHKLDCSYLIVYNGKVYEVDGRDVFEVDNYASIGSGGDFAYTALYLGKSASEAVKVAIDLDVYCGGEVHVFEFGGRK